MADVYYLFDGSNKVRLTNEPKTGYSQIGSTAVADGREVIVELYNGKFMPYRYAYYCFKGATNTSFPNSEY